VWESLSILSALADATSRVELGPLVLCGPFRNAGLIAWMSNTIDEISGGRFVLGLGAGWSEDEFRAFGFEFDRKVGLFSDQLEVLIPLLRHGKTDYEGRFASGTAKLRPAGPRATAGGPPILIAGSQPRMMGLIARWADRWNSVWYGLPDDDFRKERSDLVEACRAAGRDPAEIEVSAGIAVADAHHRSLSWPFGAADEVSAIVDVFAAWREEGVQEVMCRMEPPSMQMIETIARAMNEVRSQA
jgi:alkanesulfonate monooxygenase SsuD/methylene tetrahydromethanopterin reductase-like flavin-dependent oxidoreductase (luciferase family)